MKFLDALHGCNLGCPPLWIMRQAGRYLPSYQALRKRYTFEQLIHNSALAAEVTLLPFKEFEFDAAVLFSDILVVGELFGRRFHFPEGQPPCIDSPITEADSLVAKSPQETLSYVKETISLVKPQLKVPLIGFCGGPFTLASYLIEGGSKTLSQTKKWLFTNPQSFHVLLQKITAASIAYVNMQIEAGVEAVQIFDSWAHVLAPRQFEEFSLSYLQIMTNQIKAPVILFARSSSFRAKELATASPAAISFDWQRDLQEICLELPPSISVQGNLDPDLLRGDVQILKENVRLLLTSMQGHPGYICNLGHGILPDTPIDNVKALVDFVKAS